MRFWSSLDARVRSGLRAVIAGLVGLAAGATIVRPHFDGHWAAGIASATQIVTGVGVLVGGAWAYRRFIKDQLYITRGNLEVSASLYQADQVDVLRVRISIEAIGHVQLKLEVSDGVFKPTIEVQRFTTAMLGYGPPEDWTVAESETFAVLVHQDIVEAGETLTEEHLLPVGPRMLDTLAYRVEFVAWVKDPELRDKPYAWRAVTFVPVRLAEHGSSEAAQ